MSDVGLLPDDAVGILDVLLSVLLLGMVLLIVAVPDRRAQVGGLLGLGAVLSGVWLRLGSVDVALAEAALGGGVLSAILVWLVLADRRIPGRPVDGKPLRAPGWLKAGTGVLSGAAITVVLGSVVLRARQAGPQWPQSLSAEMAGTGVAHDITAVLLAFRAYDTLLESAVLLFSGIVALALSGDTPPPARKVRLPSVFKWLVSVAAPVLLILGLWLLFVGSSDSGGAFQSGAVFAGLLILLRLAGIRLPLLQRLLVPLLIVGVVVFVGMGLVGPLAGEPWLTWVGGQPFLMIFTIEVFLTFGITSGLYLLYLALADPGQRISTAAGERKV